MEEAQEEVLMRSNNNNSKDQTQIAKGKRTKRQRPLSPIPFVVNSCGNGDATATGSDPNHLKIDNNNNNNMSSPAATSSGEENYCPDSTEEDEDMANCLILLAQCQSPKPAILDHEDIGQPNIHSKFNSRRFLEAPSSGTGKAGYYVYECRTCNRTFPSFQALGGHRASHKKPRQALNYDERLKSSQQFLGSSDEEDGNFRNVSSLSLQLTTDNNNYYYYYNNNNRGNNTAYSSSNNNNNNKSIKVHECSICGAEFTSGQALGGHMRRHRAPTGANTTLSLTPIAQESDQKPKKPRNNMLSLDLDLNLPAPEDDPRESKFPFSPKQQQQQEQPQQKSPLVFSAAPTLVDCHY